MGSMEIMVTDLDNIYMEAKSYLGKLTSLESIGLNLLSELKYNKDKYEKAIVLLHVNPNMNPTRLSSALQYNFTCERMDIITDFFLRHILHSPSKSRGQSWTGSDILSNKQLASRRKAESFTLMEIEYER